MKAANPVPIRPVKVKTLKGMSDEEVQKTMWNNSLYGKIPEWEEIQEEDTPELDTETIFRSIHPREQKPLFLYQTTVPLPMDKFSAVLKKMTATQAFDYITAICRREKWTMEFPNLMAVLNNLDMEMSGGLD